MLPQLRHPVCQLIIASLVLPRVNHQGNAPFHQSEDCLDDGSQQEGPLRMTRESINYAVFGRRLIAHHFQVAALYRFDPTHRLLISVDSQGLIPGCPQYYVLTIM